MNDLGEFARTALEDVEGCVNRTFACLPPWLNNDSRVICEIEETLRMSASAPHVEYDKGEIEGKKLKIRQILDALNTQSSSLNGNEDTVRRTLQPLPLDSLNTSKTSASENGESWSRFHGSCMER